MPSIPHHNLNKETKEAIYFFITPFQSLDNFSAQAISIWGREFPTAEHAFQWKKFSLNHPEIAEAISSAKSPQIAKEISKANKEKQPLNWQEEKITIMEEILRAKVAQHEDIQKILKKSGKRKIIENSPMDSFWGVGPNNDGKNMLGEIWLKIRDSLK